MDNATDFAGLEIVDFKAGQALSDPGAHAYRIAVEWEAEVPWIDHFAAFLECAGVQKVRAFVVGAWGDVSTGDSPDTAIEALVGARERLPELRAIFVGDIAMEESEISWIHQGDLAPVLSAYPQLEELRARGGQGLSLGKLKHAHLRRLVVETGGLDRSIVEQVTAAELPELEHLELWLGDDGYGANTTAADLAPILEGKLFPKLHTLALRDCHYADELAKAVASAEILGQIRTLDLSLGTLSDEGGESLLASPKLKHLERLDLHHHYLSDQMMERFSECGIKVDLDDQNETDTDSDGTENRYVAVSE